MQVRSTLVLTASLAGCAASPDLGMPGDAIDEARLDRSVDEGPCGYPSAGPEGYGTKVGQRLANSTGFQLTDCEGNRFELADFFCERADGQHNRAILLNIGAGWCAPCQEETLEFPELYEELHGQGVEFVQVLFQDWNAQAPTLGFCTDWSTGQWAVGDGGETVDMNLDLAYPVLLDQVFDWTSIYLQDPQSATPVNLLLDANANIRWKLEGQKPSTDNLRTQIDLVIQNPYGSQN